ncbi:anti-sigma factor antagonist [bacterium]|nr:MAG: anti-sigma factor antagonist [bacterium]
MSQDFTLTSSVVNNFLVIETNGYININGGETIAEEAYKFIDQGITKVVLNLEQSRVVNSIGISILIEIIERLQEVGGQLYFTNLTPTIEKTFTIMGLFKYAQKAATSKDITG